MEGLQNPEGARPAPNWPPDNVSFDFAHIASLRNSQNSLLSSRPQFGSSFSRPGPLNQRVEEVFASDPSGA